MAAVAGQVSRLEVWLPVAIVLCGGLIGYGTLQARVEEGSRRVAMVEQQQVVKQDRDMGVLERLSGIEATLVAMRGQLSDVNEQLRGRSRP